MARGWESKSIESQIEAAEQRAAQAKAVHASAQQVQLERERESLQLSRTRVLRDIASTHNPKYRALLERSLEFLDQKLKALDESASKPDRRV